MRPGHVDLGRQPAAVAQDEQEPRPMTESADPTMRADVPRELTAGGRGEVDALLRLVKPGPAGTWFTPADARRVAATLDAQREEIQRLREALHIGVELDNHHNAAWCPYCRRAATGEAGA